MDIDEVVIAIMDVEDHEAITEALATAKEAFIKNLAEVDSIMEPDIDKRSTISVIR